MLAINAFSPAFPVQEGMTVLRFLDYSIKTKTLVLMICTMCGTLALMSITLLVLEFSRLKAEKVNQIDTIAKIIASNVQASVVFNDARSAQDILEGAKLTNEISGAVVLDKAGKVFAETSGEKAELSMERSGTAAKPFWLDENRAVLRESILLDHEVIGWVIVQADLTQLRHNAQDMILIVVFISALALAGGTFVLYFFQGGILHPIIELARVARTISTTTDYSQRAKGESRDEVGELVVGFNKMLEEIEKRDRELKGAYETLEDRVRDRTRELETEITTRKSVEQALLREQELLRGVIRHAPVSIAMLDQQMRYIAHSNFWKTEYGLTSDILGKTYYEVFPDVPTRWRDIHARALSGEIVTCSEDLFERADGSKMYLRWAIHPWFNPDGSQGGIIMVSDRIDDLVKAREEALHNAQLKSQFFANISHELRTPMNGVLGFTELLEETELSEEQHDYVETIRTSGKLLLSLIDDILDFSKIDSAKLKLERERFSIRNVVSQSIALLKAAAQKKHLDLTAEVDPEVPAFVKGDELRLKQVFMNLLGNSLKFTEKGGVYIHVGLESVDDDHITIKAMVRDTGIGIPVEQRSKIFNVFAQADGSTTRKYGGTGLGLSICEQLVKLMSGSIWVESEVGKGSSFYFTVKLGVSKGEELQGTDNPDKTRIASKASPVAARILIVEDNLVNQKLLTVLLKKRGFDLAFAENGEQAITIAGQAHFDLIFMDVQMPVMSGIDATEAIRARSDNPNNRTPIVALTAHALESDRVRCLEAGMNDYLSKPIKTSDLEHALSKWLHLEASPCSAPEQEKT